jgi:hypothetical protein
VAILLGRISGDIALASVTVGVAHDFTCWSNFGVMLPSFCRCALVETVAVAHDSWRLPFVLGLAWTTRPSVIPYFTRLKSPVSFQSLLLAVGQDEDSFSLVRRADFTRAEYSPRRRVTNVSQFFNDISESEGYVSFDVFKETKFWSKKSNPICDVRPEVSWIVFAESFAGC